MDIEPKDSLWLTLVSVDGAEFRVTHTAAKLSSLLTVVLEDVDSKFHVTLSCVGKDQLARIVEYLNHHDGKTPDDPPRPISKPLGECGLDPWDVDFILGMDWIKDCCKLMEAASNMGIRSLVLLCAARGADVANQSTFKTLRANLGF